MRITLLLYFIFNVLVVTSQDVKVLDSLRNELSNDHPDSTKVDLLNSIAWQYRNSDLNKVDSITHKALILALKSNYNNGKVKTYFNIGNMYYINGDFAKTLDNYVKAAKTLEEMGDKEGIANALMGIGNVHAIQQDYDQAIDYQNRALKLRLEINDSLGIAGSYNNLGSIYMDLKDFDKSLEYLTKSMKIKESLNHWKGLSSSYGNIGIIYKERGEYHKALEYQLKALEIREKLNNMKGMSMSFTDIGNIYLEQGNYEKAAENHQKALKVAKKVHFGQGVLGALRALQLAYEKNGDFEQAYLTYQKYTAYKDSIFTIEKTKEIKKIEEQYEGEKKDREIESLNQKKRLLEMEAKSERKTKIILISGLLIVLLFSAFLIKSILDKKKAYSELNKQKELVFAINENLHQANEELSAQRDEIENQKDKLEKRSIEITDSITYAKRIQAAILPSDKLMKKNLPQSFVIYKPKDIVAGDFYWTEKIGNKILFAVADCTGHGVPGAMVSVVCHNALNRSIREFKLETPSAILEKTTELVTREFEKSDEEVKDGMDIALCCLHNDKLEYAGANNPLWIIRNGEILEHKPDRQPVGKYDNHKIFSNQIIDLHENDLLYIFTDGYVDQFGGNNNKKLGYRRFREMLLSVEKMTLTEQQTQLNNYINNWRGVEEQVDDICIMGIKI